MKRSSLLILMTICAAFALAGCSETRDAAISGPTGLLEFTPLDNNGQSFVECQAECSTNYLVCIEDGGYQSDCQNAYEACIAYCNPTPPTPTPPRIEPDDDLDPEEDEPYDFDIVR
ncbi:MAG: hypothetical protein HKN21_02760 [Candidatus Eisenbacteria bacterium]|uniref:Uncharacterized protein n=1 Tax=Eiseniibacteriota bacterium TaxID=2212470 RepID=A0A7Y2H167_UNCEI|nr:hypothetical protein [Candidatus Eisenbacteria bacterium]